MLDDGRKPDTFEKVVRFVCGVFIAAPIVLYATCDMTGPLTLGWAAVVVGFALLVGFLAMIFGDRFWHVFLRLFTAW